MKKMDKRILVSMPQKMFDEIHEVSEQEYMSVSAYIRQSVKEKLEDEFSLHEEELIEKGRKQYRQGKGTSWRSIKRDE